MSKLLCFFVIEEDALNITLKEKNIQKSKCLKRECQQQKLYLAKSRYNTLNGERAKTKSFNLTVENEQIKYEKKKKNEFNNKPHAIECI